MTALVDNAFVVIVPAIVAELAVILVAPAVVVKVAAVGLAALGQLAPSFGAAGPAAAETTSVAAGLVANNCEAVISYRLLVVLSKKYMFPSPSE